MIGSDSGAGTLGGSVPKGLTCGSSSQAPPARMGTVLAMNGPDTPFSDQVRPAKPAQLSEERGHADLALSCSGSALSPKCDLLGNIHEREPGPRQLHAEGIAAMARQHTPRKPKGRGTQERAAVPSAVKGLAEVVADEIPIVRWLVKYHDKLMANAVINQINQRIDLVMRQIHDLRSRGLLTARDLQRPEIIGRIFQARSFALQATSNEKLAMLAEAFRYSILPSEPLESDKDRILSLVNEMAPADAVVLGLVVHDASRGSVSRPSNMAEATWKAAIANLFRLNLVDELTIPGVIPKARLDRYSGSTQAMDVVTERQVLALTPLGSGVQKALGSSVQWPKESK